MCSNCGSNSDVCSTSKIQTVCSFFFISLHFKHIKKKTWSLKSIIKNMSAVNEIISVNLRCEINPSVVEPHCHTVRARGTGTDAS